VGIFPADEIRGLFIIGDIIVIISHTNVGTSISQGTDALLRKGVIYHDIATAKHGIILYFFHHTAKRMIITMNIGYDQHDHVTDSVYKGSGFIGSGFRVSGIYRSQRKEYR
jgi:hypothetical protein